MDRDKGYVKIEGSRMLFYAESFNIPSCRDLAWCVSKLNILGHHPIVLILTNVFSL